MAAMGTVLSGAKGWALRAHTGLEKFLQAGWCPLSAPYTPVFSPAPQPQGGSV